MGETGSEVEQKLAEAPLMKTRPDSGAAYMPPKKREAPLQNRFFTTRLGLKMAAILTGLGFFTHVVTNSANSNVDETLNSNIPPQEQKLGLGDEIAINQGINAGHQIIERNNKDTELGIIPGKPTPPRK